MSPSERAEIEARLAAARVRWANFPPAFLEQTIQVDVRALLDALRVAVEQLDAIRATCEAAGLPGETHGTRWATTVLVERLADEHRDLRERAQSAQNPRVAIEVRLAAATPSRVPNSVTLASEWSVTPGIFGRTRHMLSNAENDEDVILMVEHKSGYSYWHCSPPGFPDCDYAHGVVSAADAGSRDAALAQAKAEALGALDRWRAEGTHDEPIEQAALDALIAHAPADDLATTVRFALSDEGGVNGWRPPRGINPLVDLALDVREERDRLRALGWPPGACAGDGMHRGLTSSTD